MAKKKKQKKGIELFDYMESLDNNFDKKTKKLMEEDNVIMNSTDFCYACVCVCPEGHKNLYGFARTFEGVTEVRNTFIESDKEDGKTLDGYKFIPAERWSRNDFISFFKAIQRQKKEWIYLMNGFVTDEYRMYIETPNDIPALLQMDELYNE